MLFNSLPFIFGFLPPVLIGYWLLARQENLRLWFLVIASVVFYGYWNYREVPLLLATVGGNWLIAGLYASRRDKSIAIAAIAANLAVLALYKYLPFILQVSNQIYGANWKIYSLDLPLGISFFTFHHIIYWVDLWRGDAPFYRFRDYALYIVNFPQILAGPLVRNREIVPQYRLDPYREGWQQRLAQGIVLFIIGLAKKVLIADDLSAAANTVFEATRHHPVPMFEAWDGTLSFTLQIYFDFSGYSDMAIGLALMLGMVLPINFDAPYRAVSLQDYWRRWHMTLSRFLRDYLYISFGGNRHGLPRQVLALLATMALGGLWHGAGWTFVLWGTAHGIGLATGVIWRRYFPPMPRALGWTLTMLFVAVTWVLFRAPSLEAAWTMLASMSPGGTLGRIDHSRTIILAAVIAIVGPTSSQVAAGIQPRRTWAVLAGAAMAALVFKMGGEGSYEFIYFKF